MRCESARHSKRSNGVPTPSPPRAISTLVPAASLALEQTAGYTVCISRCLQRERGETAEACDGHSEFTFPSEVTLCPLHSETRTSQAAAAPPLAAASPFCFRFRVRSGSTQPRSRRAALARPRLRLDLRALSRSATAQPCSFTVGIATPAVATAAALCYGTAPASQPAASLRRRSTAGGHAAVALNHPGPSARRSSTRSQRTRSATRSRTRARGTRSQHARSATRSRHTRSRRTARDARTCRNTR